MAEYLISVVLPIYNVEKYLREALDSVINQTVGFEGNIQLVLINDGSTDGSEDICLEYQQRYGDCVIYRYKENGGVSSARNLGIELATGKYITFLDPDDKWEEHSFKNALRFLEAHKGEIDVAAARIRFFEANENFHALNYKFERGTRVADLSDKKELFSVQSTTATTFIRREAIGDLRFDTALKLGEDATFINKLILKKCKYGLVAEALYYYRRRMTGNSAVNTQTLDKSFYTTSLKNYHLELLNYSKQLYGEAIPYIQSMVGYDVMWRFGNPNMALTLNAEEQKEYAATLKEILSQIDDKILLNSPIHKPMPRKYDAMYYKYGVDLYAELKLNPAIGRLRFRDYTLLNVAKNKTACFQVVNVEMKNGRLLMDILIAKWFLRCNHGDTVLRFMLGDRELTPTVTNYTAKKTKTSEGVVDYANLYHFDEALDEVLPKHGAVKFVPYMVCGSASVPISINYGKFVPAVTRFSAAFKFCGDYAYRAFRDNITFYYPHSKAVTKKRWESKMLLTLAKKKRFDVIKTRFSDLPRFLKEEADKGKIWLISDRIDNAGDNGEVLFRYLCEHKPEGVRPVFMIGSGAKEAVKQRLESIGEVIYAEDARYPLFFLAADKIISSSAGEFTINAFDDRRHYYCDLYNFTYYFMNHGVNCGDCSTWLNRFNKNMHIFFTTGESERRNILERGYNLSPEQVVITGLARFDALYTDTKKQLLVLPSWRRALRECYDEKTSSIYSENFVNTDYYRFYNGLINDERLLKVMREKGYTGLFCLHPIFMKQSVDFVQNDVFRVNEGFVDYNKAFAESAVMVTDYSTIAFDFAYLSKPIVYTQFDKEEFYENQIYDECFDYEHEGFGPVCKDLDTAVDALVHLIETDGKNEYLDRIDSFFVYHDKHNAKRITEAVLNDRG